MGIIKTETFVNEYGIEMRKDTYDNGMTITQAANLQEEELPSQPTEGEITQAKLDYLMMMQGTLSK